MNTFSDRPDSRSGIGPWLMRLAKGTLVGIGAILPGLSGGVLSVIFGLYRPLIDFLSHITRDFWKNVRYFLPVGIGGLLGVFLFSLFVEKAFGQYAAQFVCLFLGFVIGTLPSLYREAGLRGRSRSDLWVMAAATAFIFFLMLWGGHLPTITPSATVWFFSGALVALGFIVPGMSPSNFLIYFGLYDKMAAAISSVDFAMLVPFTLGAVACIVLLSKLVAHLFDAYYAKMYHGILGMVIGSTLGIVPSIILPAYTPEGLAAAGLSLPAAICFGLIMLIVGIVISYQFSRLEAKVNHE